MSSARLTICQGWPASGKTTWAEEEAAQTGALRVNRDDIRASFGGFNKKREQRVRGVRDERIYGALRSGRDVISDDTNLIPSTVAKLEAIAGEVGAEVVFNSSFLLVSVRECIKRDLARARSVGKDVIEAMYYEYMARQPKPENTGKPAIICDVDGTLAIPQPGAGWYERDFSQDTLNPCVMEVLRQAEVVGHTTLLVSGRGEQHRPATEAWLAHHLVPFFALFMRGVADMREDAEVKRELWERHIAGKYKVLYVLDDRPRVIRMWRGELGLSVFNVGLGVEF